MTYQLKTRQICFFFLAFMPVIKFFMMPSIVSSYSKQDMWVSGLINILIDFATLLTILYACKKYNTDFFTLLKETFGTTGQKIILFLYVLYFIMKALLPINEQKDYVQMTLYTNSNGLPAFLPLFLVSIFFCIKKLRVIGRCADLLWLTTIISFVVLMVLSFSNLDLGAILPVGVNGASKIFRGSFSALNWFGDSLYMIFFMGNFKQEKYSHIKIIISYAVASIIVIAFMIAFYGIFTDLSFRQRFALTETSKYTTVINNLGRFDFFAIFGLILSAIFSVITPLFFAGKLLNHIFPIKWKWLYPLIVNLVILIAITVFDEYFYSIENFMTGVAGWVFIAFGNILPMILILIITLKKGRHSYALLKE